MFTLALFSQDCPTDFAELDDTALHVPLHFEWSDFMEDSSRTLIGLTARARTMSKSPFPNHGQRTTRQLIEGYLERKAHAAGDLKAYSPGYYGITPIGYFHGYKCHDDFCKCLSPEPSLYLPDCYRQ